MTTKLTSFGNQAPTKVQCAECHWLGISSELVHHEFTEHYMGRTVKFGPVLECPVCRTPFARYPQRIEHLWSDPY